MKRGYDSDQGEPPGDTQELGEPSGDNQGLAEGAVSWKLTRARGNDSLIILNPPNSRVSSLGFGGKLVGKVTEGSAGAVVGLWHGAGLEIEIPGEGSFMDTITAIPTVGNILIHAVGKFKKVLNGSMKSLTRFPLVFLYTIGADQKGTKHITDFRLALDQGTEFLSVPPYVDLEADFTVIPGHGEILVQCDWTEKPTFGSDQTTDEHTSEASLTIRADGTCQPEGWFTSYTWTSADDLRGDVKIYPRQH